MSSSSAGEAPPPAASRAPAAARAADGLFAPAAQRAARQPAALARPGQHGGRLRVRDRRAGPFQLCHARPGARLVGGEPARAAGGAAAGRAERGRRVQPVSRQRPIRRQRTWLKRPDGSLACIAFAAAPLLDGKGRQIGVRGLGIDVTEQDRDEAQVAAMLRRSEVLDHILAVMRHEVADIGRDARGARCAGQRAGRRGGGGDHDRRGRRRHDDDPSGRDSQAARTIRPAAGRTAPGRCAPKPCSRRARRSSRSSPPPLGCWQEGVGQPGAGCHRRTGGSCWSAPARRGSAACRTGAVARARRAALGPRRPPAGRRHDTGGARRAGAGRDAARDRAAGADRPADRPAQSARVSRGAAAPSRPARPRG